MFSALGNAYCKTKISFTKLFKLFILALSFYPILVFGSTPIYFIPNRGQSDGNFSFKCEDDAFQLFANSDLESARWRDISEDIKVYLLDSVAYCAEAANECGKTEVAVEVVLNDYSCSIYVPNGFTPNGDGINDIFKPEMACELAYYDLHIFNRWREEVFTTNNPNREWNGHSVHKEYFDQLVFITTSSCTIMTLGP